MFVLAGEICLVMIHIFSVVFCHDKASSLFEKERGWVYRNKDILICSLFGNSWSSFKELNYFIIDNLSVLKVTF
jgi:hypothetical protein